MLCYSVLLPDGHVIGSAIAQVSGGGEAPVRVQAGAH